MMSQAARPNLLSPQLLARLERLEIVTRKPLRGRLKGERRSPRKGQSVEFADFRNYVVGDDLRQLDWNMYARLDKLILKLFLAEEDLHFYVLLDTSRSMDFGDPSKLEYAKQLAAALGFIALVRADRVRIDTLSQPASQRNPFHRGRQSVWKMLGQIESLVAEGETQLEAGVKNFCLRNPGRGVVVLISDLMDKSGYEKALRYFVSQQVDCHVLQILSQEELQPDVAGDLRLVDCEDGGVEEVSVTAQLLRRYDEKLQGFVNGVQRFCSQRGLHYLLASNQLAVEELVARQLRQRGLVR